VLPPDRDPAAAPKERFTARTWSLPAVIAVALVSVILGGLGGAALANAADDDDRGRPGLGGPQFQHQRGGPGVPPGMQGREERRERFREWLDRQQPDQRPGDLAEPSTPPTPARPTPTR